MVIAPIPPLGTAPVASVVPNIGTPQASSPVQGGQSFVGMLQNAVGQLDTSLNTADQLAARMAAGENVDVSQVMIAMESASIGLQTALQIRNKAVEAYQQIMAMPL